MSRDRRRSAEWAVALVAIAAGLLFFSTLGVLWPLAQVDLVTPREELRERARQFLESRSFDLDGYRSASRLGVDTAALDYAEQAFGRERTQAHIAGGIPLLSQRVYFKKRGEVIGYVVKLHPSAGVLGWLKSVPDDHVAPRIDEHRARELALAALRDGLRLNPVDFDERSAATAEQPGSRTHTFGFERTLEQSPELVERVSVTVYGDEVISANRLLRIPEQAAREARAAQAPAIVLETLGFALVGFAAAGALFVFLRRLRDGTASLGRAAIWPGIVLVCLLATYVLERANLLAYWEPLWPMWVSNLRYLVFSAGQQIWIVLLLLALVSAGDALDRDIGAGRGRSLWALGRGRLLDPGVVRASGKGFLVGLLCGGALSLSVLLLRGVGLAETAIQPRGFFFYTLNSSAPAVTSLLFFFGVALAEELGYRFFGGSWLMSLSGRRWIAIVVPAAIYGLSHTRLDFLPPASPFWGRALVLSLVGCVWGWAFFRYDALTVVLSHFTADLFIFNWPRLGSGQPMVVAVSLGTMLVPLLPALIGFAVGRRESPPVPDPG